MAPFAPCPGGHASGGRGWKIAAVSLVLLAFVLRVWWIDGPYSQFDEVITVQASQHLSHAPDWDVNWRVAVPAFSASDQYNFSAYLYASHLFRRTLKVLVPLELWRRQDGLIAHRFFSVLCGTAVVGFGLAIGLRWAGPAVALGAGFLLTVNPQLIEDAHYARPEAFMTLLAVAVAWCCLGSISAGRLLVAGMLAGLAAATKASNAGLLLLPVAASWWRAMPAAGPAWRPSPALLARSLALVAAATALGWCAGVPYALVHWTEYCTGLRFLAEQYAGSHPPHSFPDYRPVWSLLREYYVATLGWPLLAVGLGGMIVSLVRRDMRSVLLFLLPWLGGLVLFGGQRVFFERNLSPVLPGALLLAALGTVTLFGFVQGPRLRVLVPVAAMVTLAWPSLRVLGLLLGEGITGIEQRRVAAFEEKLAKDFPGIRRATGSLYSEQEFTWLAGELVAGKGELLYEVLDFNDAYKTRYLPELERRFQVVPVAEYHGLFADYPVSSLVVLYGNRRLVFRLRPL